MFSMSAAASFPECPERPVSTDSVPHGLDGKELARLGVLMGTQTLLPAEAVLALGWPELEKVLPDRGLPRGVVEIAARPWSLRPYPSSANAKSAFKCSGATSIAIAAVRSVHAADPSAWCAWILSPNVPLLYAPALVQAGVDLSRLLVLRPSRQALARTAVKSAASGAFSLLVVDAPQPQDLAALHETSRRTAALHSSATRVPRASSDGGAVAVRKLALAAEESGTTSLLLTSALAARSVPWPVALRLEVERRPDALSVHVTKDRRGVASSQHVVRLAS
jgi:recombination protein RecA